MDILDDIGVSKLSAKVNYRGFFGFFKWTTPLNSFSVGQPLGLKLIESTNFL